jgi:hypothetical protein
LPESSKHDFILGKRNAPDNARSGRFVLLVGDEAFVDSQLKKLNSHPLRNMLHQNTPNPFNPSTVIRYELAGPGAVDLRIYDVRGALVKILANGFHAAGRHETGWSGVDQHGERVASGVYFYKLTAGRFSQTRKLVLIK